MDKLGVMEKQFLNDLKYTIFDLSISVYTVYV